MRMTLSVTGQMNQLLQSSSKMMLHEDDSFCHGVLQGSGNLGVPNEVAQSLPILLKSSVN